MPTLHKNISKNNWLIGCEIECAGRTDLVKRAQFIKYLKAIHPRIVIDDDMSIVTNSDDDWAMEFKTPAMKSVESIKVMLKCFELMQKYGIYTNDSCGFHVNFSPVSDAVYCKLNPLKIYTNPFWAKLAKAFKRDDNEYSCPPNRNDVFYRFAKKFENGLALTPLQLLAWSESLTSYGEAPIDIPEADDPKSTAINIFYLHTKRQKCSRIEVRAMGNTDYHKRGDEILTYIDESIGVFEKSLV